MAGQVYRADHLVLAIQNRGDNYLAYRIQTRVPDEPRCETKGDAPHNAIVLEPHQTIRRTECLYRSDERISVRRIEVMEIPRLGAYYVSRMPPALILYGRRTSAGPCSPRWRRLSADVFLARHPRRRRPRRARLARRHRLLRPPQL